MFRSIAKLAIGTWLWRKHKTAVVLGALIVFLLFFVSMIHQDYLEYIAHLRASGDSSTGSVGLSFLIKWGLMISMIGGYAWYLKAVAFNKKNDQQDESRWKQSTNYDKSDGKDANNESVKSDPFAAIRHKDQLKSKADHVIEGKGSNFK